MGLHASLFCAQIGVEGKLQSVRALGAPANRRAGWPP